MNKIRCLHSHIELLRFKASQGLVYIFDLSQNKNAAGHENGNTNLEKNLTSSSKTSEPMPRWASLDFRPVHVLLFWFYPDFIQMNKCIILGRQHFQLFHAIPLDLRISLCYPIISSR